MKQNNNYITNYYYNYDVDCDTLIGDYVYGISNSIQYSSSGMRPFPNDLEYSCIVGNNGFGQMALFLLKVQTLPIIRLFLIVLQILKYGKYLFPLLQLELDMVN